MDRTEDEPSPTEPAIELEPDSADEGSVAPAVQVTLDETLLEPAPIMTLFESGPSARPLDEGRLLETQRIEPPARYIVHRSDGHSPLSASAPELQVPPTRGYYDEAPSRTASLNQSRVVLLGPDGQEVNSWKLPNWRVPPFFSDGEWHWGYDGVTIGRDERVYAGVHLATSQKMPGAEHQPVRRLFVFSKTGKLIRTLTTSPSAHGFVEIRGSAALIGKSGHVVWQLWGVTKGGMIQSAELFHSPRGQLVNQVVRNGAPSLLPVGFVDDNGNAWIAHLGEKSSLVEFSAGGVELRRWALSGKAPGRPLVFRRISPRHFALLSVEEPICAGGKGDTWLSILDDEGKVLVQRKLGKGSYFSDLLPKGNVLWIDYHYGSELSISLKPDDFYPGLTRTNWFVKRRTEICGHRYHRALLRVDIRRLLEESPNN